MSIIQLNGNVGSVSIQSGDTAYLNGGALASEITIDWGGVVVVPKDAWPEPGVAGNITIAGQLDAPGKIDGDSGVKVVWDLTGGNISSSPMIVNMNHVATMYFSISVSENQADGTYFLANGLKDSVIGFYFPIGIQGGESSSITVGNPITLGGKQYTLNQHSDELTLTVGGSSSGPDDPVKTYLGGILVSAAQSMTGKTLATGGTEDSMVVSSGGIANSTTVNLNGSMHVSSGGTAMEIRENGGYVYIVDGANATFAANSFSSQVLTGASATVHSGTIAHRTTINSGGHLHVSSGGTAIESEVNADGYLTVSSGGTAFSTVVNTSGKCRAEIGGVAISTFVTSGKFYASSGGTAIATTIGPNGDMTVRDFGVAADNTVYGRLKIDSGGKVTGSLEIASGARVSAYEGSIVDFDVSDRTADSAALVNDLSLIQGTPNYTITVSASQAPGTYSLANGAYGFGGTVTISNDRGDSGIINVGGTVKLLEQDYTLNLNSGALTLTITGTPAPELGGIAGDLNADGRADIIMTIDQDGHSADGSTGAWLIQENQTAAWGDLSTRNAGFVIFGTGKTAAGKNTDDVYIRNSDNLIGAWTTNNDGQVTGWETVGEFDSATQIVGLGDFNGNGQTDLLLRNNNGAVGCFFTGGEKTGWNYFQSLGDEWKLSAVGDLNGDGRTDVVLKHDAGFAGSWLTQSDGTMAWADLDTLSDGFEIVGAGDFNGDGTDDVLLKNGNYYGAWLVNNGNATGWMGLGDLGNVTVEQIADFNGDGKDDLRIRTTAGDLGAQLVMAADTLDWHYYGSVGEEWKTALAALG